MILKDFCKGIYPSCPAITNQQDFIDGLFKAAGGTAYISVSYKRQLFSGVKAFVETQKSDLRGRDNQKTLEDFFFEKIADNKVMDVLLAFTRFAIRFAASRLGVYRAAGQTTQALQRLIHRAVERGMRFRA